MDVRCERCRAQYVLDDEQVTPAGLTVQCTNCGHLFKVKKKEIVVTVPLSPDEVEGTPLAATAAAPRSGEGAAAAPPELREPAREWRVRQANGNIFTFRDLTTLQKWIIEQKVGRDDEISHSGEQWKRLGNIAELASFFQVVEAAERGRAQAASPAVAPGGMQGLPPLGVPLSLPTALYPPPPSGYPPPSFTVPPVGPPPPSGPLPPPEWRPEPEPGGAGDLGAEVLVPRHPATEKLTREELAVVKKGRGGLLAVILLLLVAAGAAAYVFAPQLLQGRRRAPETLEVPPTAEVTPEPQPAPAAQAPPPAVEAPAAPVAPPAARGPKALLAEAERLREKGELEAALDLYGKVAGDDPKNVEALTGRGLCYLDLESYPAAEASFQAALGVDPRQADALMGLAETYRWQGKKADAIRYYERFLATDPQGEDAEAARNALEELRE